MDGSTSYIEYSVKRTYKGSELTKKKLSVTAVVAALILIVLLSYVLFGTAALLFSAPLALLLFILFVPRMYNKIFKTEYDYRIAGGDMNIAVVTNKRSRKEMIEFTVKDAEMIAPYNDTYRSAADSSDCEKVLFAASSQDSPELYFAIISDEKKKSGHILVFFDTNDRMKQYLAHYAKRR